MARLFQPGHNIRGGRPAGVRNKLHTAFLADLLDEWQKHGRGVVSILRTRHPVEFAKIVAGTLPKEFVVESALDDLSDNDLDELIANIKRRLLEARKEKVALPEPRIIEHESR